MRLLLRRMASAWAILGGLVVLLIVVVTSANVAAFAVDRVARLFGNHFAALPGFEDFVRLAVSCAVLMFFPYCQERRGHVSVDLFLKNARPGIRKALDQVGLFLTALLALFLAYWMTLGLVETYTDHALSRVLGWPEWPFYLPGVLSLLLWAAIALAQLVDREGRPDA